MTDFVDMPGAKQLLANLEKLPSLIAQKIVARAMRSGGNVIRDEIKKTSAWNNRTGKLRDTIRTRVGNKIRRQAIRGRVRVGNKETFYAAFLEFGTRKMSAKPFVRPAFDSSGSRAVRAIEEEAQRLFEAEIKKMGLA